MTHKLAAGMIVIEEDKILLIKDDKDWGLPKGSTEPGETFMQTAVREAREETGFDIVAKEVAFVTEFTSQKYGSYMQVYYVGEITGKSSMQVLDPDIEAVEFIPIQDLRNYITFLPWIISLERWIKNKKTDYFFYDLDEVGFSI